MVPQEKAEQLIQSLAQIDSAPIKAQRRAPLAKRPARIAYTRPMSSSPNASASPILSESQVPTQVSLKLPDSYDSLDVLERELDVPDPLQFHALFGRLRV